MITDYFGLVRGDLSKILRGGWSKTIDLTSPDGVRYPGLKGTFFKETSRLDPETGEKIVVNCPYVIIELVLLEEQPKAGENWFIKVTDSRGTQQFVMSPTNPPDLNTSIGFMVIHLQDVEQQ